MAKGVHASTAVDAVDLMVSQPVLDLIAKSAGDAANHLDTHIMHSVAQAFGEWYEAPRPFPPAGGHSPDPPAQQITTVGVLPGKKHE